MIEKSQIKSFVDVIEAWPSQKALAADLDVSQAQLGVWKQRCRDRGAIIPAEYWNSLIAAARRRRIKGITLRLLADLAEAVHPMTS